MTKPSLWSDDEGGHRWITSRPPAAHEPPPPNVDDERPQRTPIWSRTEIHLLVACLAGAAAGVLAQVLR